MKATTKSSFKDDVLDSKKIVLLDVWAPWCGPCRSMEPVLNDLSEEVKDWAEVVKLDASVEMEQVQSLGVSGLPTFLVYKSGQIVGSAIGATSKQNLLDLLTKAR
ncbi:thioredoxin [Candidatus Saccharibacteria bacterium]|nr:thioredoxin [Candidatus Saccharibacteria bacterium]